MEDGRPDGESSSDRLREGDHPRDHTQQRTHTDSTIAFVPGPNRASIRAGLCGHIRYPANAYPALSAYPVLRGRHAANGGSPRSSHSTQMRTRCRESTAHHQENTGDLIRSKPFSQLCEALMSMPIRTCLSREASQAKLARFTFCRKSSPCISTTTHISCNLERMRSPMRSPSVSSRTDARIPGSVPSGPALA